MYVNPFESKVSVACVFLASEYETKAQSKLFLEYQIITNFRGNAAETVSIFLPHSASHTTWIARESPLASTTTKSAALYQQSPEMRDQEKVVEDWKNALDCYELALRSVRNVASQQGVILRRLDTVIYSSLPLMISSRNPHYITAKEYTLIVEWKLRRGKWRPQCLSFARKAPEEEVKMASTNAFKHLEKGDIGEAFDALLPLPGSSPSIASAILSVRDSSIPFMSHELLQTMQGKGSNFFRESFLELVEDVRTKARWLSRLDLDRSWTSVDVEKAIYSEIHVKLPLSQEGTSNDNQHPSTEQESGKTDRETNGRVNQSPNTQQESDETNRKTNGLVRFEFDKANDSSSNIGLLNEPMKTREREELSTMTLRRKRRAVCNNINGGVEVLVGPLDIEDVEGLEDVEDEHGDSLYIPKSYQSEVDGDSRNERVTGHIRVRPTRGFGARRTYHRYR